MKGQAVAPNMAAGKRAAGAGRSAGGKNCSAGKRGKGNRFLAYMRKYWFVYMLVLPGLIFMIVFDYGPMYGIQLAFKDYSPNLGVWGSPWAGLSHFKEMLVDPNFIRAFKNTVIVNLYNLVFGFTFNVFLALMINELKLKKVKPIVQTCVYLPYFLSWVIFAGLVQVFLEFPSTADIGGVVNQVLAALGGQPIDFLKRPELFRTILVITNIIKTAGYSTIVYLAAISGIDPALYESAAIDGANRKDMLLHITIPRILPSVMIMLILQLASLFISNFDQVYNLYNNYVISTGDVLSTYIYRITVHGHEPSVEHHGADRGVGGQQICGKTGCSRDILSRKEGRYQCGQITSCAETAAIAAACARRWALIFTMCLCSFFVLALH